MSGKGLVEQYLVWLDTELERVHKENDALRQKHEDECIELIRQKAQIISELTSELSQLKAERDRIVAGCLATADWLDGLIRRTEFVLDVGEHVEVANHLTEMRRIFLQPVRYDDADTIGAERYSQEEF